MEQIKIFITGGTFDKQYDPFTGELVFNESNIPSMLKRSRVTFPVSVETLLMIDSLDMTDGDRSMIVEKCKDVAGKRIVITHGTDTMIETGSALANGQIQKTIVLMGAMVPYALGKSDALFNLGSALAFAQMLPLGVYIAMNGQLFDWSKVEKNREKGVFEKKPDHKKSISSLT